ncbi:MAG: hypothetical protein AAGH99_11865 [Planctomycetota bacterium]
MSEWLSQIENHQIHDSLRAAISPAEEIRSSAEDLDPALIEKIDRIVYVLNEFQRKLGQTDPNLIPIQPLTNATNQLSQIQSQLSSFLSNRNNSHIQSGFNYLENILVHMAQIPSAAGTDDMDSIREAAIALRRSAGQHMRHVDEEGAEALQRLKSLKEKIESLESTVEQQAENASSLNQEFTSTFDTAEEEREKSFTAAEEKREIQTAEILEGKQAEWEQIVEDRAAEYQELYESIEQKIDSLTTEVSESANSIIRDIKERHSEAEAVVGAITDTGMVGGYQRMANSENTSAMIWKIVAALSLIGLVTFAIVLFSVTLKDDFEVSIPLTLTRIFIAAAVALLAGYAARQADKHEQAQRRYRTMELELASITPYLHEFPEEERQKIKADLAMKMFASSQFDATSLNSKATTQSSINALETAIDTIKNLVGKN